jgi:tetratricopeptide (TPR) repeat protein
MIRQTALVTTLALALAAGVTTALAQPTAAQAAEEARKAAAFETQKQLQAALTAQLDASALEGLARKAEAQAGNVMALSVFGATSLSDQQARDVQLRVEQLAKTAGPFQVGRENTEQFNYQTGLAELDAGKWQSAVDAFDRVIKAGGAKADGATYWKAYAQNRLGQRSEALSTLDALLKKSPNSRWAGDAKALQLEVRQAVGRPVTPEQESDEELKLLAIRGLLNTDAERALPMLEALLQSNAAPKLKDQALFVLGMSESPKAREILVSVAKGRGNPDLQLSAIKYLGFRNAEQNRPILVDIYKSTTDIDVKRRVIEALSGTGGQYAYALAQYYAPNVRVMDDMAKASAEAAKASAAAAAVQNSLWNLYQSETELKLKEQMVRALAVAQSDKVMELARAEKNQELRQTAIQSLGMMKSPKTSELLMSLYKGEKDAGLKKAIIRGLYTQRNATALVQIARDETDPAVKKDVVEKLSTMKDKEAVDYMIELLRK